VKTIQHQSLESDTPHKTHLDFGLYKKETKVEKYTPLEYTDFPNPVFVILHIHWPSYFLKQKVISRRML
jgi:hypothetical protein